MPEYLSLGVYVEEVPSANKSIAGVGTSTGAFVGIAEKGLIGESQLIGNHSEFFDCFGGYISGANLAYAVNMFFANGGTRCYVVRTCAHDAAGTRQAVPSSFIFQAAGTDVLTVDASSPGEWGDAIRIVIEHYASDANIFTLRVYHNGEEQEVYEDLVMDSTATNFVEERINDISKLITLTAVRAEVPPSRPDANSQNSVGGNNGATGINDNDFTGVDGLQAFDPIDDINMVCMPDRHTRNVMQAGMNYCQKRRDCFFIAHAGEGVDTAGEALAFKEATGSEYSGQNAFNSSFGALYVPWVETGDPLTGKTKTVPPDGAVAGRYAATDVRRGVHKAPAGTGIFCALRPDHNDPERSGQWASHLLDRGCTASAGRICYLAHRPKYRRQPILTYN